jgi:hypothetical protein
VVLGEVLVVETDSGVLVPLEIHHQLLHPKATTAAVVQSSLKLTMLVMEAVVEAPVRLELLRYKILVVLAVPEQHRRSQVLL